MTDRDLLELAAKAAGYTIYSDAWACGPSGKEPTLYTAEGKTWNPLADDGDALRLAVKLRVGIQFDEDCDTAIAGLDLGITFCAAGPLCEEGVRRNIVRAAAEIGRGMA